MTWSPFGARREAGVRWSADGEATLFGQTAYFAEFLDLAGPYRHWQESCPLRLSGSEVSYWGIVSFIAQPTILRATR